MLKTALNTNIIPHIWKLANIVPIPKPNKDIGKCTSYMTISHLSVIAKTPENSLFPYITANIPNTPTQHGYKTQHSTVTALHTVNNSVAKGFNQIAYTHLSESCYRPTFQAQSLSSSQTTSRDAKHTQHIKITYPHNNNSNLAFHKVASFHQHYSSYTLQIYHHHGHQFRSWPTQMTSPSHLHTQARVQQRNTYNHKVFSWTKHNNITPNPDKTTCTLFTPDPAEYKSNLDLKINYTALRMATHPKVLGLILDPKLTFTTSQYKHTSYYK